MGQAGIEVVQAGPDRQAALAPGFGRAFVDEPRKCSHAGSCGRRPRGRGQPCGFRLVGLGAWEEHPWNQPGTGELTDDGGRRYGAFWDWVDSRSPNEPLWQLDSIAIESAAQGRGVGTALIAAGLELARADGVGACLSTGTPPETFPSTGEAASA